MGLSAREREMADATFKLTPAFAKQMRTSKFGALPKVGDQFRLIGQASTFNIVRLYLAAGFIPSVYGETPDGEYATCARLVDIMAA